MKKSLCLLVMLGAMAIYGCGGGKAAAEAAIASSEAAFNAVKEQATNIAPDQAKNVEDAIAAAKASVEKGDYATALTTAKEIPAQVKTMADGLPAKQAELQAKLDSMKDLPTQLTALKARVDQLDAMRKLPAGMDKNALQTAKDGVERASSMWAECRDAMQSGKLAEAVAQLEPLKQLLVQTMTAVGMPVPDMLKS